jgi:O-antigen polymerase
MITKWKAPEVLLVLLFLVAPFYYHPNLGGEGLRIPHNSTIWLVAVIFIALGLLKIIRSSQINLPKHYLFIASFPALLIISSFITGIEQPVAWVFRLLFILGGLGLFLALLQYKPTQKQIDRLLLLIVVSAVIHSVMGVVQLNTENNIPYFLPKSANGQPYGFFQQINNQASFLATTIIMGFYLSTRPIIKHRKTCFAVVLVSMLLASFIIGLSSSRVGVLALILALPLLFIARVQHIKKNKAAFSILILATVMGFSAGAFEMGGAEKTLDKTTAMQSGYSGSARLGIYKVSTELVKESPFFGYGIGSFARVFQHAKPEFLAQHPNAKFPAQMVSHPHNEILFWLVEAGIVSIIGILIVCVAVMLALNNVGWSRGVAYFAMLIPIVLHTQVELPFYMSALHWLLFVILLAVIIRHSMIIKQVNLSQMMTSLIKVNLLAGMLICCFFLIHTVRANWDFVSFYKGEQRQETLTIAKQNPYLYRDAVWIDRSSILYSSMQYGYRQNVLEYINWGMMRLNHRPDIDLYIKLMHAYGYLGDKQGYCVIVGKGLEIYPDSTQLRQANFNCQ